MKRAPRLLAQMLAANLITVLPLLACIGYAVLSLEDMGTRQQALLVNGVAATRMGDEIADRLTRLERAMRQQRVLHDPGFAAVADISHRQLDDLIDEADALLPGALKVPPEPIAALRSHLEKLPVLDEAALGDDELAAYFADSAELGAALRVQIRGALEARLQEMEAERVVVRRSLVILGSVALPLTIATALFASLLVARPVRKLMGIVHRLGMGGWGRPVELHGPADLVELGVRLEWLRRQLITTDTQMKSFARDVTHELKTPLAAVIEAGSLLADGIPGPVNARQREVLALLGSNASALRELIEQLLRYNSVTHDIGEDDQPYRLRELVDSAVAPVADLAATKQLQWDIEGGDGTCAIDSRRLRLVMGNLLSNGVRYSPPGGRLSLHWHRNEEALRFSVIDDGEGIADEDMDSIFKPFYTRGAHSGLAQGGTGLGLTIVRECVVQLGGEIHVSNVDGRGACFEVLLPLPGARRSA